MALILGLGVGGGLSPGIHAKQPSDDKRLTWAKFDLHGSTLKLKSERWVRQYRFDRSGIVSVSIGNLGELIKADLWKWRLSQEWMQLLDADGKLLYQMRLLKVDADTIAVENGDGGTDVFEIEREAAPKRRSSSK